MKTACALVLAYARVAAEGSSAITATAIPAAATDDVALAPDGAIWTITSRAQLVRDGAIIALSTPNGAPLLPVSSSHRTST